MIASVKALVPRRLQLPARYWYRAARHRLEEELGLAVRLTRPGSTAVDVGANVGLYSYALSRRARVEAFEPVPGPAAVLEAFSQARRGLMRVHRVALSDAFGTATLRVPIIGGRAADQNASLDSHAVTGDYVPLDVELRTLDSFDLHDVSLLKIDTEGHEAAVLRGATGLLMRERPALVVEIEQRHLGAVPIGAVFAQIATQGYVGGFIADGRMQPIDRFDYAVHQQPCLAEIITDPRYVNNFVFVPREDTTRRSLAGL